MHILILLVALVILSWSGVPLKTQIVIEALMLMLCVPDLILGLRKSPPFIPSMKRDVRRMMTFADVQTGESVIDPGCGDGRLVFAAADLGAHAVGYEMAIPAWMYAKVRSLFHRGSSIQFGDFWTKDYSKADVVFCYLLPDIMQQFYAKIWPTLKPGCRVVSNSFTIKALKPDKSENGVYLYIK